MAPEWLCKLSHFFVGFVSGLLPLGGGTGWASFERYELNEQKHLERHEGRLDPSYQEFQEWIVGWVVGRLSLFAAIIWALNEMR